MLDGTEGKVRFGQVDWAVPPAVCTVLRLRHKQCKNGSERERMWKPRRCCIAEHVA